MQLAVFKQRVGQRLGVVPTSGSLSAEDAEIVSGAYATLVAELYEHELANWNVTDPVPDEFADIMIGMTAARLVDEFQVPEPRRSGLIAQHAFGLPLPSVDERRLRRMMSVGDFGDDVVIQYF